MEDGLFLSTEHTVLPIELLSHFGSLKNFDPFLSSPVWPEPFWSGPGRFWVKGCYLQMYDGPSSVKMLEPHEQSVIS